MQLQKQALEAAKQALIGHGDECTEVNEALALIDQALVDRPTTTENNGGKTGWPPGLLQDDCKGLSKWLSNRPDAKRRVREALAEQALDKMAENARELGLDYEPAQQEPVAYLCENAVGHKYFRWKKPSSTYKPIALYTSPQQTVPDALHHTDTSETLEYIQGWNDCRALMLSWRNK